MCVFKPVSPYDNLVVEFLEQVERLHTIFSDAHTYVWYHNLCFYCIVIGESFLGFECGLFIMHFYCEVFFD